MMSGKGNKIILFLFLIFVVILFRSFLSNERITEVFVLKRRMDHLKLNNTDFNLMTKLERDSSGLTGHDKFILEEMETRNASLIFHQYKLHAYLHPGSVMLKDGSSPNGVVFITSQPKDVKRRNNIRKSWGQWAEKEGFRAFFFIGLWEKGNPNFLDELKILQKEQSIHDDLIVIFFKEGYYRLVIKVLRIMEWFLSTYSTSSKETFFIKADQDAFLNLPALGKYIQKEALPFQRSNGHFIGGSYYVNNVIQADPKSKFYLAYLNYWMNGPINLPDFALGPCYILSRGTVQTLFNAAFSEPLFPFEDAFFTGNLRTKLGLGNVQDAHMRFVSCGGKEISCGQLAWKEKKMFLTMSALLGFSGSEEFPEIYRVLSKVNL